MLDVCAALRVAAPRTLDKDTAHRLRGDGKKMGAVLPVHALVVDQAHVRFVDQRCGLQAVAGTLTFQEIMRQTVEFGVDDRRQSCERALVPVSPRTEQRTHVVRNGSTDAHFVMPSLRDYKRVRHFFD